jgi:hypothetical protein
MNRIFAVFLFVAASVSAAVAAPMSNTAKSVIPAEIQQIISVDYRSFLNSTTAMALKNKLMPEPLKRFEDALRRAGVSPENDVEQLVFASFRTKDGLRVVGIAQGQFPGQKLKARLIKQKVKGAKYRDSLIYPMGSGMYMSLLDNSNMLFGDNNAVKTAIDTRDGEQKSLNSNDQMLDLVNSVQSDGAVWSVLDQEGTQTMLKSALGEAANLADYDVVKKRVTGSKYAMNFERGVDFDLNVITSDSFTAATLSSLLKAGVMVKKASANDTEKIALESVTVNSDNRNLNLRFRTDDNRFQALLNSDLFKEVSR